MALMLYAKYGRIGVELLQSVARDLGLDQNEESLKVVKNMLEILPQNHPIKSYMRIAPDLQYDAGLVDTFLHGRDKSYSVNDCMDLVTSSGLVFQDMFIKSPYYLPPSEANDFYSLALMQPEEMQWSIMERINFENGCHFFTACHKSRSQETYKIDFSSLAFLDYIPEFRFRCTLQAGILYRYNWSTQLNPIETMLIERVDGRNNIRKILSDISHLKAIVPFDLDELGRATFQRLWRLDFLLMGLKPSTH